MLRAGGAIVLAALIAVSARGQDAPRLRISEQIADVEWQVLPADAYNVHVGPDGRAWFTTMMPPATLEQKLKAWADEYRRRDPQQHWFPVLFEPDGRVWFTWFEGAKQGRLLLRYDGNEWLRHELPYGDIQSALCAAGHVFFSCANAIHVFDGKEWSVKELWPARPQPARVAYRAAPMKAEPDGLGVVALSPAGDTTLLRWRDGMWSTVKLPVQAAAHISAFQPDRDGVWLIGENLRTTFVRYTGEGVTSIRALILSLRSEQQAARDSVRDQLVAGGWELLPVLQGWLGMPEVQQDPVLAERLKDVLEQVRKRPAAPPPAPVQFGSATIRNVRLLAGGPQGRMFLGGENVAVGTYEGPAVIMRDPDGDYLAVRGNEVLTRWGFIREEVTTPDGGAIWLPGNGDRDGIALFDLRTGRLSQHCPDLRVTQPIGGTAGGPLYAKAGLPTGVTVLMRYAPGRPKVHVELEPLTQWGIAYDSAIEEDGSVVSYSEKTRLLRFHDGQIVPSPDLGKPKRTMHMMAGREGGLLLWSDDRSLWTLATPDRVVSAASIEALIEANADLFVKHMSYWSGGAAMAGDTVAFAVDKAGRIWLGAPKQGAKVFQDGRWTSIAVELQAQGGMADGRLVYASPVGDGSGVFLSNIGVRGRNVGLIARYEHGRLLLHETVAWTWPQGITPVRMGDGTLWVHGQMAGWQPGGMHAFALDEKGIRTWVKDALPLACDRYGNVFLLRTEQGAARTLVLWRDGKELGALALPGLSVEAAVCTVSEDRILVWTGSYLQEVVRGPAGRFVPGRLVVAKLGRGNVEALTLTRSGKLMAKLFVNDMNFQRKCVLFDLAALTGATQPAVASEPQPR